MMQKILIIEDNVNDLMWYRPLFYMGFEISFLFFNKDKSYTKEKFIELTETLYEDMFSSAKGKFFCDRETIELFLINNIFDFYIIDSLGGAARSVVLNLSLSKEKTAFLSSTTSFRKTMQAHGYRTYKKKDIQQLIEECLNNNGENKN